MGSSSIEQQAYKPPEGLKECLTPHYGALSALQGLSVKHDIVQNNTSLCTLFPTLANIIQKNVLISKYNCRMCYVHDNKGTLSVNVIMKKNGNHT